ncbi:MAG TPA: hypothetical protein DD379_20805 [Cyanobacteria bacterium UBA11162]|nr:hypothetical protein [Cyanobacteria bacterium UBA11162]
MYKQQANLSERVLSKFVQEYYQLAILPELSERDAERMAAILELAQYDDELNSWLYKIDHFVAEELEEDSSDSNQPGLLVDKQISLLTIQEKQNDDNKNWQFNHRFEYNLSSNYFAR